MVESRELYIVNWDWMLQFPKYHQKGKTEISEWDHYIRFPKARLLPNTTETFEVERGLVHITKGVPVDLFKIAPRIQRGAIPCNALPA